MLCGAQGPWACEVVQVDGHWEQQLSLQRPSRQRGPKRGRVQATEGERQAEKGDAEAVANVDPWGGSNPLQFPP